MMPTKHAKLLLLVLVGLAAISGVAGLGGRSAHRHDGRRVLSSLRLNVGGHSATASMEVLLRSGQSPLAALAKQCFQEDVTCFIDSEWDMFKHILFYLRTGMAPSIDNAPLRRAVAAEARWWALDDLAAAIEEGCTMELVDLLNKRVTELPELVEMAAYAINFTQFYKEQLDTALLDAVSRDAAGVRSLYCNFLAVHRANRVSNPIGISVVTTSYQCKEIWFTIAVDAPGRRLVGVYIQLFIELVGHRLGLEGYPMNFDSLRYTPKYTDPDMTAKEAVGLRRKNIVYDIAPPTLNAFALQYPLVARHAIRMARAQYSELIDC